MKFKFIIKAGFLCFITLSSLAKDLTVGSEAPAFALLDENGEKWNSADFLGKKNILIFFYTFFIIRFNMIVNHNKIVACIFFFYFYNLYSCLNYLYFFYGGYNK